MTVGLTPYQLRFCPASYLHEAHLPSSWAQVPKLLPEWRTLPASNGALLEALALGIGYEMPAPLGGLALFPQSELVLLLRRLGAVLHGEAIRRCSAGTDAAPDHRLAGGGGAQSRTLPARLVDRPLARGLAAASARSA